MNKNHVAATFEDRIDMLKESVQGLVDFGVDRASSIKHRVVDAKDRVISGGGSAKSKITDTIKAHPFAAVGVAFGVGYIAMRWFRR